MLLMCYLIRAVKSIEHNIEHNMKKNIEEFVLAEYFLAKKQRKKCHKTIFLKKQQQQGIHLLELLFKYLGLENINLTLK